jgi:hypothetical protein
VMSDGIADVPTSRLLMCRVTLKACLHSHDFNSKQLSYEHNDGWTPWRVLLGLKWSRRCREGHWRPRGRGDAVWS